MDNGFRRLNFFKGFATTAEDWQASETYHREKRRLHNQYFHSPGVIAECLQGLAVTASKDGSALCVMPGMALDGEGRELYLPQSVELDVNVPEFRGANLYVVITYKERAVDHRPNTLNSDYAGDAFIEEVPDVTITREQPDNMLRLELARIDVSSDATTIQDPKEPLNPSKNEINRVNVKRTGRFQTKLEDLAVLAMSNQTSLNGKDTRQFDIMDDELNAGHRYFVASVLPVNLLGGGQNVASPETYASISWRILAQLRKGQSMQSDRIRYILEITNSSAVEVQVSYRVYRFR